MIQPEQLSELSLERKNTLLKRSMEDISDIYEQTRGLVQGVQTQGDQAILKHYKKHKADMT